MRLQIELFYKPNNHAKGFIVHSLKTKKGQLTNIPEAKFTKSKKNLFIYIWLEFFCSTYHSKRSFLVFEVGTAVPDGFGNPDYYLMGIDVTESMPVVFKLLPVNRVSCLK